MGNLQQSDLTNLHRNNTKKGIALSFVSLGLLSIMPVISNSRPMEVSAVNFSLFLLVWQLIFSVPVAITEYKFFGRGILAAGISRQQKIKALRVLALTGLMFGLSTYLYVLSLEKAGTLNASIAIQAYPLFAIVLETVFQNKKKTPPELLFTFLLMLGLIHLSTHGSWIIGNITGWLVVALCVPFIWSVAHIIIKDVLEQTQITPAQVTFFRSLVSTALLFGIALATNGSDLIFGLIGHVEFQMFSLVMGLVYYLELVNWFYAVKYVDVSVASSITTPWPALTAFLAAFFLGETIFGFHYVSMVVIFLSVYGILLAGRRQVEE